MPADFIAGRPGEMTGYAAQDIGLAGGSARLRTQMEEGKQLGDMHDEVAGLLTSFVQKANQGLARYTDSARSAGHDYTATDESNGVHINAIGDTARG